MSLPAELNMKILFCRVMYIYTLYSSVIAESINVDIVSLKCVETVSSVLRMVNKIYIF
jgi:hypothetical protein